MPAPAPSFSKGTDMPHPPPAGTTPASLGWTDHFSTAFDPYAGSHRPARVARVDRGAADALLLDGSAVRARTRPDAEPAVGDWVALARTTDHDRAGYVVDAVLPRRTAIERAAATGRSEAQVLAANVDLVLVVVPTFPPPKAALVERMLALAWDSGATPLVVLAKSDLTNEADAIAADLAEAAPGVDVVAVNAVTADGLDALRPYLAPGRTLCLVGRSGAGKSTLANALAGAEVLATAGIRSDGKGRHTTTHRQLVPLPGGAVLLDTPGLRGAGLWVTDAGLDRAFGDVDELVEQCRFSDCAHVTEPGCAVLAAVDDGRLSERRLQSWRKLQREAAWMASRNDARLRAERARQWKLLSAEVRRSGRIRPG